MSHKFEQTTRRYIFASIERVAVGASDASSSSVDTTEVLLHASTDCFININAAATSSKFPLIAGEKFHLQIEPGSVIHVIQSTAGGYLYIIPVY